MIISSRKEERSAIDVIGEKPAKIIGLQLQANDIGYYIAVITDNAIKRMKLQNFDVMGSGSVVYITINPGRADEFKITGTDTVLLYNKPFNLSYDGLSVGK